MWTTGAGFGVFGCATCLSWSWSASLAPGGSQIVTTTSTVSITSTVVVMVMSCLFSKGMGEDKATRAPKARVVDSFMAANGNALDVNRFQFEGEWVKSVMNGLAIVLLRSMVFLSLVCWEEI